MEFNKKTLATYLDQVEASPEWEDHVNSLKDIAIDPEKSRFAFVVEDGDGMLYEQGLFPSKEEALAAFEFQYSYPFFIIDLTEKPERAVFELQMKVFIDGKPTSLKNKLMLEE